MSSFDYYMCLESIITNQKRFYLQRYLNMIQENNYSIDDSTKKVGKKTVNAKKNMQGDINSKKYTMECIKNTGKVVVSENVKECLEKMLINYFTLYTRQKINKQ